VVAETTIIDNLTQEVATQGEFARTPNLPSIPSPRADITSLTDAVKAIKTILEIREGNQSVMDKALTLRDLINAGALTITIGGRILGSGSGQMSLVGVGSPGAPGPSGPAGPAGSPGGGWADPRPYLSTPPTLTGFTATGTFQSVFIDWAMIDFVNFSHVEIVRATTNSLGSATLIGNSTAYSYVDKSGSLSTTYYYWGRAVGIDTSGTTIYGAYNAVGGTAGGRGLIGGIDLGPLIIDATKIANGAIDIGGSAITGSITDPARFGAAVIGTAAIANLAVTNALINNLAVDNAKIALLAVGTANIADAAITTLKVGDAQINNAKIVNLDAAKIDTGYLSANRIQAGSIDASKVDTRGLSIKDAAGTVILAAGTSLDFNTRFAVGTTNLPSSDIQLLGNSASGHTITGNSISRATGGGFGANDSVYSADGFAGGAFCSFVVVDIVNGYFIAGLSANKNRPNITDETQYEFIMRGTSTPGLLNARDGGAEVALGSYTAGAVLAITYDGVAIRYLMNGAVLRTVAVAGLTLAFQCSIVDAAGIKNVRCGAMSSNQWTALGGAGKADDNATVGAVIGVNLGGQITSSNASTFIAAAAIGTAQVGVLTAGNLTVAALSNTINGTTSSGQRVEVSANVIRVFDSSNVLRVKLGDLS
jgi:hypothetical protein